MFSDALERQKNITRCLRRHVYEKNPPAFDVTGKKLKKEKKEKRKRKKKTGKYKKAKNANAFFITTLPPPPRSFPRDCETAKRLCARSHLSFRLGPPLGRALKHILPPPRSRCRCQCHSTDSTNTLGLKWWASRGASRGGSKSNKWPSGPLFGRKG